MSERDHDSEGTVTISEITRKKIAVWIAEDGNTGISSMHMAGIMLGAPPGTKSSWSQPWPHDPDDFKRCYELIQRAPEIREHLHLMKRCGEVWSRLVDHWDEMTRIYERDAHTGQSEELYELMRSLGA